MKALTVITTTYNRGYCLEQVYNSLVNQQSDEFVWLIVDDGSDDNTGELVKRWKSENLIEIEYIYKKNGGMHTARNIAYDSCKTELNVIIDSDDWMADGAVEHIVQYWNTHKNTKCAGMITQNMDPTGKVIGSAFPAGVTRCGYAEFFQKYNMHGDKKLVLRTELTKKYPFPEFDGEKFYPASYKYYLIDKDYDFLLDDYVTCIVDYNDNSMTRDKYAQYKTCPRGFMHYRKEMLKQNRSIKEKTKDMIHYVMESRICHAGIDLEIKKKPLFYVCFIPGVLFKQYIFRTNRKY